VRKTENGTRFVLQQPLKIIFHINETTPQGPLWQKIVDEVPCLHTAYLEAPKHVFGNEIENVLHQTDVARWDSAWKFCLLKQRLRSG